MLSRSTLILVLWLVACAPRPIPPPDSNQIASSTPLPTKLQPTFISTNGDITQMPPTPSDPSLQSLIEKAKEDLAQRLGVSVDSVTVAAVIGQEFSTDAFYCRTKKERIAKEESPQVISGQSILLSASGRRYEYHASDQTVIFCRPLH